MTETSTPTTGSSDATGGDVFAAARWFETLWNSTAKAVSPSEVEWQCTTWGSGRGNGDWVDTAVFEVVAEAFDLVTSSNDDGRDELIVHVPLDRFPQIAQLIDRLGEEPEMWSWLDEDVEDDQEARVKVAAEELAIPVEAIAGDTDLLVALRIACG